MAQAYQRNAASEGEFLRSRRGFGKISPVIRAPQYFRSFRLYFREPSACRQRPPSFFDKIHEGTENAPPQNVLHPRKNGR